MWWKKRPAITPMKMETSLMLLLKPEWVAPLETAGDGAATPSELPAVTGTPVFGRREIGRR